MLHRNGAPGCPRPHTLQPHRGARYSALYRTPVVILYLICNLTCQSKPANKAIQRNILADLILSVDDPQNQLSF